MTNPPDPDTATLSQDELKVLGKLDERTKRIDDKVDRVIESTEENADQISTNRSKVKRNTTVLGGFSAGITTLLLWSADKLARFI